MSVEDESSMIHRWALILKNEKEEDTIKRVPIELQQYIINQKIDTNKFSKNKFASSVLTVTILPILVSSSSSSSTTMAQKQQALECLHVLLTTSCYDDDDDDDDDGNNWLYELYQQYKNSDQQQQHTSMIQLLIEYQMANNNNNKDMTMNELSLRILSTFLSIPIHHQKQRKEQQELLDMKNNIAIQAIFKRCSSASKQYDLEFKNGFEEDEEEEEWIDSLSQFPRRIRSLCYQLLQSSLILTKNDRIDDDVLPSAKFIKVLLSSFQGETDPRCLLQVLTMISQYLIKGYPQILSDENFVVTIFDAVAPYYPIHFTPPPNDPHRITPQTLQSALFDILCACPPTQKKEEEEPTKKKLQKQTTNMITLTLHLFLDRFYSTSKDDDDDDVDDNDDVTVQDQIEALQDIQILLQLETDKDDNNVTSVYKFLDEQSIQDLANALRMVHQTCTSKLVMMKNTTKDNVEYTLHKKLSETCRLVASKFTYRLEQHSSDTTLWKLFLQQHTLQNCSMRLPQSTHGRATIAYIATIAGCGGKQSCQLCLQHVLPDFLDQIVTQKGEEEQEEEQLLTSLYYGIAAMISSIRNVDKNDFHSLLEPYADSILSSIKNRLELLFQPQQRQIPLPRHVAILNVFETFLLVSSTSKINTNILQSFQSIFEQLITEISPKVIQSDNDVDEAASWKKACSQFIGTLVSKLSLKDDTFTNINNDDNMDIDDINDLIVTKLWSLATMDILEEEEERYDWSAIAYACKVGEKYVSEFFVTKCTQHFIQSMTSSSACLQYLFQHGGTHPSHVFFHSTQSSILSILDRLSSPPHSSSFTNDISSPQKQENPSSNANNNTLIQQDELKSGMDHLMLPEARDYSQKEAAKQLILSYSIIRKISVAFESSPVPIEFCQQILSRISKVLPPLSEWDEVVLGVMLPVLCMILINNANCEIIIQNDDCGESLQLLLSHLTEYYLSEELMIHDGTAAMNDETMNNDAMAITKNSASRCIFIILARVVGTQTAKGQSELLFKEILTPALTQNVQQIVNNSSDKLKLHQIWNLEKIMTLVSIIGSATAYHNNNSSSMKLADSVGRLLVDLACKGYASKSPEIAIDDEHSLMIRSSMLLSESHYMNVDVFSLTVASAFGSFMRVSGDFSSTKSKTVGNPFWKQRLTHILLPTILSLCQDCHTNTQCFSRSGPLIVATHIACCVPLVALGKKNIQHLFLVLLDTLRFCTEQIARDKNQNKDTSLDLVSHYHMQLSNGRNLALGALIKIMSQTPSLMKEYFEKLIELLLLLCSDISSESNNMEEIEVVSHLQILQCFSILYNFCDKVDANCKQKAEKKGLKDKIVNYLRHTSIDSRSYHVRQAGVKVLNQWSVFS